MKILLFVFLMALAPVGVYGQSDYIEVTAPGNRQLKMAVSLPNALDPLSRTETAKQISEIIVYDMNMSGVVVASGRPQQSLSRELLLSDADFLPWLNAGFDLLVSGEFSLKDEKLTIELRLFDVINRKLITAKRFLGSPKDVRRFSHSFADEMLRAITGEKGVFTTKIAYVSTKTGNKEIYVMDWDGNNPLPLTKNGSINMNPDFSPNGREIIFTSYKRGNPDLYRRSLYNTAEVALSKRKGLNYTGSWSPDGSRIALALSKDGDAEIYTMNKDGSNPVRLTNNRALDLYPAWSPDGKKIAFVSDRLGKPQIFVMNSDGSDVRRLTKTGSYNVNPRWSPKGDKIAYSRMSGGGFNIFTVTLDGSSNNQLTTEGNNENPSWSADGRFLCFSSKRSGVSGIYVMRSDGTGQTKISKGRGGAYFQPVWSAQ